MSILTVNGAALPVVVAPVILSLFFSVYATISSCDIARTDEPICESDSGRQVNAFVLLPDTQFYSCYYNDIFRAQTRWIEQLT